MLKSFLVLMCLILSSITGFTQTMHRYKDIVFTDVTVDKDMSYNGNTTGSEKNALFDIYQPKTVDVAPRPLIIWMHGGGFKYGSKNAAGIELWCKTFAQRGYVCAAVNYRLSKKNPLFHFEELKKSCYNGVLDIYTMLDYFKKNAARFNIDPDKIILAGNSAGGMLGLQAAYTTANELARQTGFPDATTFTNEKQATKIIAVINLWGAVFDLNTLKNNNIPIVSIHGRTDSTVPLEHKNSPLYGSLAIHNTADSLRIPNAIKIYDGYSHELQKHFNPFYANGGTKKRWLEAGQFAADFLYSTVLNPAKSM